MLALSVALAGLIGAARGADFARPAHELGEAVVGRWAQPVARRAPTARPPASRAPGSGRSAGQPPGSLRYLARGVRPIPSPSLTAGGRRLLRALGKAGEHSWFLCVGYRGLRNDARHPRSPREFISPGAAVDVFNACFNPLGFLLP